MFEVLAFVFDNYWSGDSCPELPDLHRKLNSVGFDSEEIQHALLWLEDLKSAAKRLALPPQAPATAESNLAQAWFYLPAAANEVTLPAMRVLTAHEQKHLQRASWGYLIFLASAGVLPRERFELVMDRVLAAPGGPVSVDDLKLIVLMVYWTLDEEPDALILDELCDNREDRLAH